MNNKGFAITTILYGTFLLFLLLMLAMLAILNNFKNNMDKLVDGNNGARKIVELRCEDIIEDSDENGFYHISELKEKYASLIDNNMDKFDALLKLCDYPKDTQEKEEEEEE